MSDLDAKATDTSTEDEPQPEGRDLPEMEFGQMPDRSRHAAERAGWSELMPVQARAIPYLLNDIDLMVQSRTGSGKTGAFLLPLLEKVDPKRSSCQAMILTPTRELARQVAREAEVLAGQDGVRTVAVYGGVAYGPQLDAFRAGAHVVIGTPGRVLDHLIRKSLTLDDLRFLVFDEADRMLSMGFYPDMQKVRTFLPKRRVHGSMFSATYPVHVMQLAQTFLHKPEVLSLSKEQVHVTETAHIYYEVPAMEKDRCLVRLLEVENPHNAIVFCNTRAKVDYVTTVLQRFGYDADKLSSDLSQKAREKVLTRVRNGKLRYLVATDVAARGIDIPELSHVIMYEAPEDPESYIHRAGRTGRAGATGEALSLVAGMEKIALQKIADQYNMDLQKGEMPSDEDVEAVVAERITALLEARLRERDRVQRERMERFVPLARALAESEDESAVIAMLLDDYYQQSLHPAVNSEESQADSGDEEKDRFDKGGDEGKKRRGGRRRGRRK